MRPVQILRNPVAEPGVCGKCTSQDRDWYVDLGFDTMFNSEQEGTGYPLWTDGVIYLCCDCFNSLVVDAHAAFQVFFPDVIDPRPNFTSPVGLEDIELDEDDEEEEELEEPEEKEQRAYEEDNEIHITVTELNNGNDTGNGSVDSEHAELVIDSIDGDDGSPESSDGISGETSEPVVAMAGITLGS